MTDSPPPRTPRQELVRAADIVIVLVVLGVGALLWAAMPDSEPAEPIGPPITTTTTTVDPDGVTDNGGAGSAGDAGDVLSSGAPVSGSTPEAPSDVGHCGCEGTCAQCHHLCLECHCGDHIIDRGVKCQELAACEVGCSGDARCDPPLEASGGGGATPCDLVDRLGADIDDIPSDAVSADLLAALGTDISDLADTLDCG